MIHKLTGKVNNSTKSNIKPSGQGKRLLDDDNDDDFFLHVEVKYTQSFSCGTARTHLLSHMMCVCKQEASHGFSSLNWVLSPPSMLLRERMFQKPQAVTSD